MNDKHIQLQNADKKVENIDEELRNENLKQQIIFYSFKKKH